MSRNLRFNSASDLEKFLAGKNIRPKYGNVRVVASDGEKFDSIAEQGRLGELVLLEKAGVISNLKKKVQFDIIITDYRGEKVKIRSIIPDASYTMKDGERVLEDVKGYLAPYQRLKYELFEMTTGMRIKLYKQGELYDLRNFRNTSKRRSRS